MRCLVLTFLWMSWLDLIFEHSLSCCFQLHRLEILLYILYAHHSHMVTVYSSERAWCHTSNSSRSLKMIYFHLKLSAGTVWVLIMACPICDLKNVKRIMAFDYADIKNTSQSIFQLRNGFSLRLIKTRNGTSLPLVNNRYFWWFQCSNRTCLYIYVGWKTSIIQPIWLQSLKGVFYLLS